MKIPLNFKGKATAGFFLLIVLFIFSCSALVDSNTDPDEPEVVAVTGASIVPYSTQEMNVGETLSLTVNIAPSDATDKTVVWDSSNESTATIDDGQVSALAAGVTTITVTTNDGGFTDTVRIAVPGVTLTPATQSLSAGETADITAEITTPLEEDEASWVSSRAWVSSNTSVATVADGTVTAVADGSAVITLTITTDDGDYTDTATVTVTDGTIAVTGVNLTPETLSLTVGGTDNLTAVVSPSGASNTDVSWESSNTSVATVVSGTVTAVAAGTATITVTTDDGAFTDTTDITVSEATGGSSKDIEMTFVNTLSTWTPRNLYVIWAKGRTTGEVQHLYVCARVRTPNVSDTVNGVSSGALTLATNVIPYWRSTVFDSADAETVADVDAVTQATVYNSDMNSLVITETIDRSRLGDDITIYFEVDRSSSYNDWFEQISGSSEYDEPAVVFAVDIDLSDANGSHVLEPIGWTPMYSNTVVDTLGTLGYGDYQTEMRYITHSKDTSDPSSSNYPFGDADDSGSFISKYTSITATISDTP